MCHTASTIRIIQNMQQRQTLNDDTVYKCVQWRCEACQDTVLWTHFKISNFLTNFFSLSLLSLLGSSTSVLSSSLLVPMSCNALVAMAAIALSESCYLPHILAKLVHLWWVLDAEGRRCLSAGAKVEASDECDTELSISLFELELEEEICDYEHAKANA